MNVEPTVKVNGELCSGDYSTGIYKLTNNFELSDSVNFFTIEKEFRTSATGFPDIKDTVMTTNFIIEKRDNAVMSSGVTLVCNTGSLQKRSDAVRLQNRVLYRCRGNVLTFEGTKLQTIDIVSLKGTLIAQIAGFGKDFVSFDARHLRNIKPGFYCAKVKSSNGLSTIMIAIGINSK